MRPPKGTKELWRMMGEEKVHNELILKQYGIIALAGGVLKHRHFEVMRLAIGRHCDNKKKTFSMYRLAKINRRTSSFFSDGPYLIGPVFSIRVDAPYKPLTDHGTGKRMGGGKGSIDEYCTPVRSILHSITFKKNTLTATPGPNLLSHPKVRAGKVVLEVGGLAEWAEVSTFSALKAWLARP